MGYQSKINLNLFYEEPERDRWVPLDRYPRRVLRRVLHGKARPGGQMRVFLNLCAGLDRIGVGYRVNDYKHIQKHSTEIACIIGKPHVLDKIGWKNPILFGASIFSHPSDDPELLNRLPIQTVLIPGEWMRKMCEPYWGNKAKAWPVGIDTEKWCPNHLHEEKDIDILLYDKVRWEHDRYEKEMIIPISNILRNRRLSMAKIRYGYYREEEFQIMLKRCRAMIFLCEHETQGIAYQQALSCGVPILAWDRGGYWQDPAYYPHRIKFAPVSSVPYWDERCGVKFTRIDEFSTRLEEFIEKLSHDEFSPRDYILENLTLEKCAQHYIEIFNQVKI